MSFIGLMALQQTHHDASARTTHIMAFTLVFILTCTSVISEGMPKPDCKLTPFASNYDAIGSFPIRIPKRTAGEAVIKTTDMPEEMQKEAADYAKQAVEQFTIQKDIAAHIKKEFDKKHNPTWHCIVGRDYGSYVTTDKNRFIYYYVGDLAILLFKAG